MSGVFVIKGDNKLVEMEEQMYESEDLRQTLLEDYTTHLFLLGSRLTQNHQGDGC